MENVRWFAREGDLAGKPKIISSSSRWEVDLSRLPMVQHSNTKAIDQQQYSQATFVGDGREENFAAMQNIEASSREQSPRAKDQNHEDGLGKKRPRRSASSSPRSSTENKNINDNSMDVDKDSKIADSSISATTTAAGHTGNKSLTAPATDPPEEDASLLPIVTIGTGVSLPWFESGGPLYQRPPSLLWDTPKDVDRSRKGERKRKRVTPESRRLSSVVKHQFSGLPIHPKRLGVCAECGIDEQGINGVTSEPGNVVVLCDGPGCDRELHLKCCRPPLQRVPEGDFYCFDCHPDGGYAVTLLEKYLDEVEDKRDAHNEALLCLEEEASGKNPLAPGSNEAIISPSRRTRRVSQGSNDLTSSTSDSESNDNVNSSDKRKRNCPSDTFTFVDKLIYEDMEENQPDFLSQVMNGIDAEASGKGPPKSELEFLHNDKELLVGCAIRLYCPKTNHYQTGRILQFRGAPRSNKDPNNIVLEDYNRAEDTECLVYFPAGRDYRKTSVTRWLRLEEHSLAVASPHLVWGKFASSELDSSSSPGSKKSKDRWVPTKLWLRSSRELVMSMHLLEESMGQISYRGFREQTSSSSTNASPKPQTEESPEKKKKNDRHYPNGIAIIQEGERCSFESKSYVRQDWILGECAGRGIYKLVHVSTETVDYCCKDAKHTTPSKRHSPGKNGATKKKSPQKANHATPSLSTKPRENEIMMALVHAEQEERNRILSWNKLALKNTWHKKALTGLNEYSLGSLAYDDSYNQTNAYEINEISLSEIEEDETTEDQEKNSRRKLVIEPTPLVRTGLDRMYILEQFVTSSNNTQETSGNTDDDKLKPTKDLAISLSCELVGNHSITSCIQKQNRIARLRQKEKMIKKETKQVSEQAPEGLIQLPESVSHTTDTNSTATIAVEIKQSEKETTAEVEIKKSGGEMKSADDAIQIKKSTGADAAKTQNPSTVIRVPSTKNNMVTHLLESPTSSTGMPLVLLNEAVRKGNGTTNLGVVNGDPAHDANSTASSTTNKSAKRKRSQGSRIIPGSTLMEAQNGHENVPTDDRNSLVHKTQSGDDTAKKAYNGHFVSIPTTALRSDGVTLSMSQVFENLHEQGEP